MLIIRNVAGVIDAKCFCTIFMIDETSSKFQNPNEQNKVFGYEKFAIT